MENTLMINDSNIPAVAAAAREQYEIQSQMMLAMKQPRDEVEALARIRKSFSNPRMAEEAQYSFPRGKTEIKGPSIDCAVEIARNWGNMRYGMKLLSVDGDYVHIKGFALDLQTNTLVEYEDKFKRLIQRKSKDDPKAETKWVEPDERDLRELTNKRGSFLVRNSILRLIPGYITEEAIEAAENAIARQQGARDQRDASITRLVSSFQKLGVSFADLTRKLGHPIEAMTPEEFKTLSALGKSLKDGQIKLETEFPWIQQTPPANDKPAAAAATTEPKPETGADQNVAK